MASNRRMRTVGLGRRRLRQIGTVRAARGRAARDAHGRGSGGVDQFHPPRRESMRKLVAGALSAFALAAVATPQASASPAPRQQTQRHPRSITYVERGNSARLSGSHAPDGQSHVGRHQRRSPRCRSGSATSKARRCRCNLRTTGRRSIEQLPTCPQNRAAPAGFKVKPVELRAPLASERYDGNPDQFDCLSLPLAALGFARPGPRGRGRRSSPVQPPSTRRT